MQTFQTLEQLVHAALDSLDPETIDQYAEHVADNYDRDHLRELALAFITGDDTVRALALMKIAGRIDRQRAEFTELEALRRMRKLEEHLDALDDLDAELRGAA
ncbi:hypothetical protein IB234_15150 [Pseudomonas sp. PDM16]|uniref:hypothetical protein n=1 Tax=Pseudomonas sp. PDM16 TaxID=2769292 RepID=UPI00177D1BA6|nr:hypothetical protein [Pseudomonas sp. PDM16]MBD9415898.1 hypothetical protein [Pseudomonas sp. PDM16]